MRREEAKEALGSVNSKLDRIYSNLFLLGRTRGTEIYKILGERLSANSRFVRDPVGINLVMQLGGVLDPGRSFTKTNL